MGTRHKLITASLIAVITTGCGTTATTQSIPSPIIRHSGSTEVVMKWSSAPQVSKTFRVVLTIHGKATSYRPSPSKITMDSMTMPPVIMHWTSLSSHRYQGSAALPMSGPWTLHLILNDPHPMRPLTFPINVGA